MDLVKCYSCDNKVEHQISHIYCHNDEHIFCKECLKDILKICTCEKPMNKEPTKLVLLCPCSYNPASDDLVIEKVYFDLDPKYILDLVAHWNNEFHVIYGCKGCKFEKEQIETDFTTASKSAIDACVYSVVESEHTQIVKYLGDALDEHFTNTIKNMDPNLYKELQFDNIVDV